MYGLYSSNREHLVDPSEYRRLSSFAYGRHLPTSPSRLHRLRHSTAREMAEVAHSLEQRLVTKFEALLVGSGIMWQRFVPDNYSIPESGSGKMGYIGGCRCQQLCRPSPNRSTATFQHAYITGATLASGLIKVTDAEAKKIVREIMRNAELALGGRLSLLQIKGDSSIAVALDQIVARETVPRGYESNDNRFDITVSVSVTVDKL